MKMMSDLGHKLVFMVFLRAYISVKVVQI